MKKLIALLIAALLVVCGTAVGETVEDVTLATPEGYWTAVRCDSVDMDTGEVFTNDEYPEVHLIFNEDGTGYEILSYLAPAGEQLYKLEWQDVNGEDYTVKIYHDWGDSEYDMRLVGNGLDLVSVCYEAEDKQWKNTLSFMRDAVDPVAGDWHLACLETEDEIFSSSWIHEQGLDTDLHLGEDGVGYIKRIQEEPGRQDEVTWEVVSRGTRYRFINTYTEEEYYLGFDSYYDWLEYDVDDTSVRYYFTKGLTSDYGEDDLPLEETAPELGN